MSRLREGPAHEHRDELKDKDGTHDDLVEDEGLEEVQLEGVSERLRGLLIRWRVQVPEDEDPVVEAEEVADHDAQQEEDRVGSNGVVAHGASTAEEFEKELEEEEEPQSA
jgi:hypothetical protein